MILINKSKILALLLLSAAFFMSSCFSEKKIAYFQKTATESDTVAVPTNYTAKIQSGDILSITINSLNPEASSFFNSVTPTPSTATAGTALSGGITPSTSLTQSSTPGFLVDESGHIEIPILGSIKVSGLSTMQTRDTIKSLLKTYLKEPIVIVRYMNFKISVLGEVGRPSVFVIPNEVVTLPEALSMAGDLTIFARRDNIQIIRDVNGKKEFGYVNLNSRDIFKSPYYYLHANDVVYVQPGKKKAESTDRIYQILPSIVGLASVIIILIKK